MSLDSEGIKILPLPVEGKPKEESDPLEDSLLPRPDSEAAEKLARVIHRTHHEALQDREEWESRLAEWEDQYYGRMPQKDFPWPGAANFQVPLTAIGVDTYKPRLVESVLGQDPPIQVVPVEHTDETRRDRVELFLNWQVRAELEIAPVVAESAHLFMIPGTVVAKTYWDVQRRRRQYVREFPKGTPLQEMLESLWGQKLPQDIEQVDELEWTGTIPTSPRAGGPLDVRFRLKFLDDGVQIRVEEEYLIEKPRVELLEPPDVIMPAKGGADIQRLPWVQHRMWLSEDELRARVRQGVFDRGQVEKLLERANLPAGDTSRTDATQYREGLSSTEGVEDQGPSNVRKHEFEVLEDYRFYDVDEEGRQEHIIAWYCKDLPGELLGWDLLDNVYAHGRRPLRLGRAFPIPFRTLGLSFAEIVRGIEDEATTIHNQRVDFGTITNLPFFFYRASSTLAPFPQRLRPGEGVPIDNPQQDVNFPKWGGGPAFGQQEEALLMQYYERRTGLSDLSLGRQPTRVGATRTAAGTSTLLQEAGLRQKTVLEAFQRFWIEIFEDVLALNQEYLPPGKEFRVTGRMPEFIRLKDRTEIQGRYDLRLAATTQTMNRVVAREDATTILQAVMNPALLQSGLIGVKGVQRAFAKFLKAFDEDPDAYLELHATPMSPEEELAMIVSGAAVKAVPGTDVATHLQAHQQQMQNPLVRSVLKPEGVQALQRLMADEMQLMRSQMLAQALQQQGPGRGVQGSQAPNAAKGQTAPQPNAQPGTQTSLPAPGGQGGAIS